MKKLLTATLLLVCSAMAISASAQRYANNDTRESAKGSYGKNLLTITPIGLTDRGVSVGLSYERALDDKGILQFSLPIFYTFNDADGSNYNNYGYNNQPSLLYAYPGLKIYPTGAYGIVRYGIGPSFVIAGGKTYDNGYSYNPNTQQSYTYSEEHNRFIFGVMVTNSLNVNFNKKFYLGTEVGLGLSYINTLDGYRNGTTGLARVGFSFGYRF